MDPTFDDGFIIDVDIYFKKRIIHISVIENADMKLSLRQLEIFATIAKTQNVSRAAERLAMSQSAASSALVELERQFDNPLFDRIGKSLHLNSTGEGLLPLAESLLDQAADIEAYLAGGAPGPLNIGATLTIGNYLATLVIADYMQLHPASPVQLHVTNTASAIERMLRFESDLALIEGETSHPDLLIEPWLEDELVVFCSPQHPLARAKSVDSQQLAEQFWILRETGSGTRALFDRALAPGLGQVKLRLELEHTEAIKRTVESGLGVGCLSRLALREAFRRGSLIEIPTPQFQLTRHFHIVRHRQRYESQAVSRFLDLCRKMPGGETSTAKIKLPFIP